MASIWNPALSPPSTSVSTSFRPHFTSTVYNGLWGLMFGQAPHLPPSLFSKEWDGGLVCCFEPWIENRKFNVLFSTARWLAVPVFHQQLGSFLFFFFPLANQTWEEEKETRAKVRWWWERRDHEVMWGESSTREVRVRFMVLFWIQTAPGAYYSTSSSLLSNTHRGLHIHTWSLSDALTSRMRGAKKPTLRINLMIDNKRV